MSIQWIHDMTLEFETFTWGHRDPKDRVWGCQSPRVIGASRLGGTLWEAFFDALEVELSLLDQIRYGKTMMYLKCWERGFKVKMEEVRVDG